MTAQCRDLAARMTNQLAARRLCPKAHPLDPDGGRSLRDVVRQQWNFTPAGSAREAEDYRVDLSDVTALELTIVPDVSGGAARASLAQWRIA